MADALSRWDEGTAELSALSAPQFSLFDEIRREINDDTELFLLRDAIRGGAKLASWSVVNGLIHFKGRVFIAATSSSRRAILEHVHGTGHEGVHKTLHHLRADFHFLNDRVWCRISSARAWCARGTRASIFSREACCSRLVFLWPSGRTWPWILWRHCPR